MQTVRHFILGTAGHIDHGKSTLVEALTGTDPDRLPEERRRGMTIELGFAHLGFDDPGNPSIRYDLGIVDVPGHADFVRNMVAGVGSIHVALIIVAADDGWMPQTAEHVEILQYLGVQRVIITVTKSDLLEDEDLLRLDLADRLTGTPYADSPVVLTSALGDSGLDDLRATIAALLRNTPDAADIGKPRLAVDRVFSPRGIGSVVTGSLTSGTLEIGQEVMVMPAGLRGHIRALQSHNSILQTAQPGMRTAINLSDIARATDTNPHGLKRGDTLVGPTAGTPRAVDCLDVELFRLPERLLASPSKSRKRGRGLPHGMILHWHHGSTWQTARVHLASGNSLGPGERRLAQLRFKSPVYVRTGDRFILRDPSKLLTLAGGIVLDTNGQRRGFRRPAHQEMLRCRATHPDDPVEWVRSLLQRDLVVESEGLFIDSQFSSAAVSEATQRTELGWLALGPWLILEGWWTERIAEARERVRAHHHSHPEQVGLPLADLRRVLEPSLPDKRLFELILAELERDGFVRGQGILRAVEHAPQLPQHLEQAATALRGDLTEKPLEPPTLSVLAPDPKRQQVLKFLVETGEVICLDPKTHILQTVYLGIRDQVVEHLRDNGKATASELRAVTGTTRRILMPLLERLDSEGFTQRDGDHRMLP